MQAIEGTDHARERPVGADIDTLAIGPYLAPGARDAAIDLASTGETYLPGVLTLSVAR